MAGKILYPISYRDVGLHIPGVRGAFIDLDSGGHNTPEHTSLLSGRIGHFPRRVSEQPGEKVIPIRFRFATCDHEGQFWMLSRIFDPSLGPGLLVMRDGDLVYKQVTGVPQTIVNDGSGPQDDTEWVVSLLCARPVFEAVIEQIITDDLDNAIVHQFITDNEGTYFAQPTIEIEPLQMKTAAQAWTKVRQITYAHRSELPLTGPAADAWLIEITGGGWDTATIIAAGGMQSDGRDIAVFIDDIQVPDSQVYINGINTATTRIWVKISDGPAISAPLSAAVAAGATSFTLTRGDHGFSVGDFIVWNDSGSAKQMALIEAISTDGKTLTVQRAVRNTPNANSTAASTRLYRSGRHIQLAYGWSGAPVRPALEDSPLIDLDTSSNLLWEFNLAPFWADANRRPGGFRRLVYPGRDDVPSLRQNRLAFKTALFTSAGIATFLDAEPSASAPNFDAIEFVSPVGIDDSAGAIEYDATVDYPFTLQVIGRDFLGLERLLASRLGHEAGDSHEPPAVYTNQTETPSLPLSAVIFRARNILVTGVTTGDNNENLAATGVGVDNDAQDFVLDNITRIDGVVARLRRVVNVDAVMYLLDASGDEGSPGLAVTSTYVHTLSGAGPLEVCFHEASGFVAVTAGGYHTRIYQASGAAGNLQWMKAIRSLFARGAHWEHDGANWNRNADEDMWFFILSESVDNQEDMEQGRTGESLLLDNIKITFDPDRTMIVDPRPAEDAYYINTNVMLANQMFDVRYLKRWADVDVLTIDTLDKQVFEGKDSLALRQVISAVDDEWLTVPVGRSNISVSAPNGAVQEAVRILFRDTYQS